MGSRDVLFIFLVGICGYLCKFFIGTILLDSRRLEQNRLIGNLKQNNDICQDEFNQLKNSHSELHDDCTVLDSRRLEQSRLIRSLEQNLYQLKNSYLELHEQK